jgi:hypothetical protein
MQYFKVANEFTAYFIVWNMQYSSYLFNIIDCKGSIFSIKTIYFTQNAAYRGTDLILFSNPKFFLEIRYKFFFSLPSIFCGCKNTVICGKIQIFHIFS